MRTVSSSHSKIPIIILCGLLIIATVGIYYDSHQNIRGLVCTSLWPQKNDDAAEILFIGSSVVGRSIDPSFISEQLEKELNRSVSVEKLAPVRNYTPRMYALIYDYVKNRGAPDIVIFNLPYSNYGASVVADARMLWKIPYTASEDTMLRVGQSLFKSQDRDLSLTELAFHRDGASHLRLKLEKLTAKLYGGLRYPILAFTNKRPACPKHLMEEHAFILASTIAPEEMKPIPKSRSTLEKRQRRYLSTKDRPLADPTIESRRLETDQINEIIDHLTNAGSSVYITTIPRFNEYEISEELVQKYSVAFKNAIYIDLYSELNSEQMELFQQSFNDGVHVDQYGGFVMSQFWVDRLETLASD